MQAARFWLPNREEFFVSLDNLITSAQRQRQTASYDSAKFFVPRLQENERILAILTLMIEESFPNEVGLINDLRLRANGCNNSQPLLRQQCWELLRACFTLAVVCKRIQQLPKSLGPAVHRGKNTTHTSL